MFPATTEPAPPTRWALFCGWASDAWLLLRGLLAGGDRFASSPGKHSPTQGWSPREVARQLAARPDLADELVADRVRDYFRLAGLPVDDLEQRIASARAVGVAQVVERPSWEDIDRKRREQAAWLADPDRTGWMPLVESRRDGAR